MSELHLPPSERRFEDDTVGVAGHRASTALEITATLGLVRLVLETGTRSAEALALYRRGGFTDIPAYGEYTASPGTSVCLAKAL